MYGCRSTCESTCVYVYVRVCVRVYMRTCRYMRVCCVICYSCDVAFQCVRCAGWQNITCIRPICELLILNKGELLWANLAFFCCCFGLVLLHLAQLVLPLNTDTRKPSSSRGKDTQKTSCQTEAQHREGQTNINQINRFTTPFLFLTERKVHSL